MKNLNKEKNNLNKVSKWYRTQDFYANLVNYCFLTFKPYFKQNSCLELGCADGLMTAHLVKCFKKVVAIDGSEKFCDLTKNRIKSPNLEVICSLFEEFETEECYHTIIMAHILEHLDNPVMLMKRVKSWLKNNGVILIDVPCADSIHRQAAVKMGLLKKVDELNDYDKKLGHKRVYKWETLQKDIIKAGLKIVKMGGIFLKPLTNAQIGEWFTREMIDAFFELGKDYPKIAAEIYAVCKK